MTNRFHQGFETLHEEHTIDELPITGSFPDWLQGTLIRNGPGQFEVGETDYRHWFDGLAMLRQFSIAQGRVSFRNRFVRSEAYRLDNENGRINFRGFAVDPCMTLFRKAMLLFDPVPTTTNAVINVQQTDGHVIAMTEAPIAIEFDPQTLETIGEFEYERSDAATDPHSATAHPHFDFARGRSYNYMLRFGPQMQYRLYSAQDKAHRLEAAIPTRSPAYMHSFSITDHYIVLAEYPFRLPLWNLAELVFGARPFIENFRWFPDDPTRFIVIDKDSGEVVNTAESDGFFAFHHINAYEQGNDVIVDLCAYPDASIIDGLYLENLRGSHFQSEGGRLKRCVVPLSGDTVTTEIIGHAEIDLPNIHYREHNGKPYTAAYGVSYREDRHDFVDQLAKIRVDTGETHVWYADGCYPSEPVFVPAPGATQEDEGVILSVVLDTNTSSSYLLALDATTFEERARATVPVALPFDFHGQFFA